MKEQYLQRAEAFESAADVLKKKYNRYSLVRLLFFVAAAGTAIYLWAAVHALAGALFILAFLYTFYRFILWHQAIQEDERHQRRLAQVNHWEAACIDGDFSAFEAGEAFIDAHHPNSLDLDLFGPWSFFQYTNRAGTALGRQQLAAYLLRPAAPASILERQQAVAELSKILDWRQHFQAYGLDADDSPQHLELLKQWLSSPPFLLHNRWMVLAIHLSPLWTLAALALWAYFLPWYWAILFFLPPAWLLKRTKEQVDKAHLQTAAAEQTLAHYAKLIRHIEGQAFQSPLLQQLHAAFGQGAMRASRPIARLSYIISQLNTRYNFFAIFLNLGGLWDLQWAYRLEQWKEKMASRLPAWFEAMAGFEALSSFANLYHNNPDWAFPTLHDEPAVVAREVGHPLIAREKRVCNDISIPTDGHIKLITGSNMAGKSTFLRTVGLNLAMAMSGAPACARQLALPPLMVYTSMRTQDALHESTSSFYAELKRLKFIIEAIEAAAGKRPPELQAFFLLDEILKGTNSTDRHTGSKALIRQLIRSRGSGLIATHDLELGQLEATAGGAIENLCIEVEIQDGKLYFDYKLKKGVSRSFNATLLMQQMGIKIEEAAT
ncbi:MAG: hypothetical protein KDC66_05380 [Phaeodactylibacter sp.]|nr:hypothetical protein [Phaeodactylibacter sp.]MCB9276423.1 hypothetical protein [Lewinellaceae bacterium]